ncbi:MAG: cysteine synthase family protein [Bryobacteraceae bacterium]|jgi:cysteine synthase A
MSSSLLEAIGNTPLVELRRVAPGGGARVFVKLEYYNPTGSYKDRMARSVIEGAERRGVLKPGMRVVEYTGGSTGSSLAMVCAVKGYRFTPVCSDAFAREKLDTMRAFGAEPIIVLSEGGNITPDLWVRMKAEITRQAAEPGTFWADQFNNEDVMEGYAGIGTEVLGELGSGITAFCGAVGTAGMIVGVSRTLKAAGCRARMIALEPGGSPFLTTGVGGAHRVEGTAAGFWPPLLKAGDYDEIRVVDEGAARAMVRRLAREEGIFAGTSTGLNVEAAIGLARELGPQDTVVTVACDSGMKYLAGDLYL